MRVIARYATAVKSNPGFARPLRGNSASTRPQAARTRIGRDEKRGSPWRSTTTTSPHQAEGERDPPTAARTPKAMTAAPTERLAAKDPPTAARTPKAMTAAPTERLAAKDPPTAARTPKAMTAVPTERHDRG